MAQKLNIHGTAIVIDGHGILLRGNSGAGKSLLALELIAQAKNGNRQAILLADDRVDILIKDKQIIMQAPPLIAGKIELFGHGIVTRPYVKSATLDLIVDFVDKIERMPNKKIHVTKLKGITIPQCFIPLRKLTNPNHQTLLIDEAIANLIAN